MENDKFNIVCVKVKMFMEVYGYCLRIVVGKFGLDGYFNGVEMILVVVCYVGFDVIYFGICLSVIDIV